jgi:hypothetical protein
LRGILARFSAGRATEVNVGLAHITLFRVGHKGIVQYARCDQIRGCLGDLKLGFDFTDLHFGLQVFGRAIGQFGAQLAGLENRFFEVLAEILNALLLMGNDIVAFLDTFVGFFEGLFQLRVLGRMFLRVRMRYPQLGFERANSIVPRIAFAGRKSGCHARADGR